MITTELTVNLERTIDYEPVDVGGETLFRKHDKVNAYIFDKNHRIVTEGEKAMAFGTGDTPRAAISEALKGVTYFDDVVGPLPE